MCMKHLTTSIKNARSPFRDLMIKKGLVKLSVNDMYNTCLKDLTFGKGRLVTLSFPGITLFTDSKKEKACLWDHRWVLIGTSINERWKLHDKDTDANVVIIRRTRIGYVDDSSKEGLEVLRLIESLVNHPLSHWFPNILKNVAQEVQRTIQSYLRPCGEAIFLYDLDGFDTQSEAFIDRVCPMSPNATASLKVNELLLSYILTSY